MFLTIITLSQADNDNEELIEKMWHQTRALRTAGKFKSMPYFEQVPGPAVRWNREWENREHAEEWIAFVKSISTPIACEIKEI